MYYLVRTTALTCFVGCFSLVPTLTYSVTKERLTLLSSWHPSDQVPILMCISYQNLTTGDDGGRCITVLERIEFTEIN